MVARRVLTAIDPPAPAETVAACCALPLYRVRASLRETGRAGLVACVDDRYTLTELGREALELSADD